MGDFLLEAIYDFSSSSACLLASHLWGDMTGIEAKFGMWCCVKKYHQVQIFKHYFVLRNDLPEFHLRIHSLCLLLGTLRGLEGSCRPVVLYDAAEIPGFSPPQLSLYL